MEKSVAIVTGASQGIGRATAIRLARNFAALALVARDHFTTLATLTMNILATERQNWPEATALASCSRRSKE